MIYEKQVDLLEIKERMGLTNLDIAQVLRCAPSTASGKLCGFCQISPEERKRLLDFFKRIEAEQAIEMAAAAK